MRLIALSIVIFSGCFLAAAGTVAEALPDVHRFNDLDIWGLLLAGIGFAFFVLELLGKLPEWSVGGDGAQVPNIKAPNQR